MCSRILICKIIQLFADFAFLCLGIASLIGFFRANHLKVRDARILLVASCLETDSSGFIHLLIVWGTVLGVAVTFASILGIFSSLTQRMNLLFCYSTLTYVLTLAELLFFLVLYIHLERVVHETSACLKDVLVRSYSGPFKSDLTYAGAWDFLHRSHRCCGVDGGKAFNSMVNWNRTWINKYEDPFFNTSYQLKEFEVITVLPYTCCIFKDENDAAYNPDATVDDVAPLLLDQNCPSKPSPNNSYTDINCFDLMKHFVVQVTAFVFDLSLVAELLQLMASMSALYVSKASVNKKILDTLRKERMIH